RRADPGRQPRAPGDRRRRGVHRVRRLPVGVQHGRLGPGFPRPGRAQPGLDAGGGPPRRGRRRAAPRGARGGGRAALPRPGAVHRGLPDGALARRLDPSPAPPRRRAAAPRTGVARRPGAAAGARVPAPPDHAAAHATEPRARRVHADLAARRLDTPCRARVAWIGCRVRLLSMQMGGDYFGEPTMTEAIRRLYAAMPERLARARREWKRPLTLTEKILVAHVHDWTEQVWERGRATLRLRVDRVAMQDATGQMALLQFMQAGKPRVAVPSTVHCDHLIRAQSGAAEDLQRAIAENREVYEFLHSASRKYGIGFWKPGSGIIHQVVLENYAFPGGLMIGADSHTPNAGGLGMLAIGVGGVDCGEVMAGLPWEVLHPKLIGVHLVGKLAGWTAAKDVITSLCGLLTVKGGTNKIIEYFGPGAESISATGKGTICNMGAELGATTSVFPYDDRMAAYLEATERSDVARAAESCREHLVADPEVLRSPRDYFDEVVEIDLGTLEPHVVGPHSPDRDRPISKLAAEVRANGWPAEIKAALIGSCTNSSYEDMRRAAHVARQGIAAGLRARTPFLITPGSERIYQTIKRDGIMATFEAMGGTVLANACGPCIGQWRRSDVGRDETNTIVSSFNRNFPGRNDGSQATLSF